MKGVIEMQMDNLDKTIEALCDWIQRELKSDIGTEKSIMPDMVKSLAELVSAREKIMSHV